MAERDIQYLTDFLGDHAEFEQFDGVQEALEENDVRKQQKDFIESQRPVSTARKTLYDVDRFQKWLADKSEFRKMDQIHCKELDVYLAEFFMKCQKKDGKNYEPDTLSSFQASFDRHLRAADYEQSLYTSIEFSHCREMLTARRKQLKRLGLGNRPNKATPFTPGELDSLREKNLLGYNSPESLANQLFLNNCLHFGMRSRNEHHELLWGDITVQTTHDGKEYIEYTERTTKTRTGEHRGQNSARKFLPKAFQNEDREICPVTAYKIYRDYRPASANNPECKFYLALIPNPRTDIWFKNAPMGINKLGDLMKNMALKGELTSRKVNHSGRKTCVTTLLHADVHPTLIQQLTGHKNLESINHYATASLQQQEMMSKTLAASK